LDIAIGGTGVGKKDSARRSRGYWDNEASTFDEEPDHGLRDPLIRQAWADELRPRGA